MSLVNVPPQQIPQGVLDETPKLAAYLIELNHYNWQMFQRTGGGSDAIDDITSSESFENSFSTGQLQEQINDLEQLEDLIPQSKEWSAKKVTTDTLAVDHEVVEGNQGATIKFDPTPDHNDEIIVANGDGTNIRIDFNGKNINFTRLDTSMTLNRRGTSMHFKYFADGPYWRVI
jgi:hypothetical protein